MPEYNKPSDQPAFIVDSEGLPTKVRLNDKWYDMIPSVSYPSGVVHTVKWLRDYAVDMLNKKNDNVANNLLFAADALEDYALAATNKNDPNLYPVPYPNALNPTPYPNTNPAPYPMLCKHEFIVVPASDNPHVPSPGVSQCRICGFRPTPFPVSR